MCRVIEITVSPEGEVTVQTKGYAGSACQTASKFIEEALGMKVNEQKTAEFYQSGAVVDESIQTSAG